MLAGIGWQLPFFAVCQLRMVAKRYNSTRPHTRYIYMHFRKSAIDYSRSLVSELFIPIRIFAASYIMTCSYCYKPAYIQIMMPDKRSRCAALRCCINGLDYEEYGEYYNSYKYGAYYHSSLPRISYNMYDYTIAILTYRDELSSERSN